MKKFIKLVFVAAFAAIAGYNIYCSQNVEKLSDMALANIEALAMGEIDGTPDPIDPNTAYGYELKNCYDDSKPAKLVGATCVQSADFKSECKYSSCWGKC